MPAPRPRHSPLTRFRAGEFAHLPRRAWLTLRYHGLGTFVFRILTFPLRLTPWGARFRAGLLHRAEHRAAKRWYARKGRPATVVLPTYGDPQLVLDAVASIRRTTDVARTRILVVDDGSAPEHKARLRSALSADELILGDEQLGFAANVNRGLRAATGDVVLLNSDVLAHPDWLVRLQQFAYTSPVIGIVGPKLLYPDRRIQWAGSHRNLGAPEWFDHRFRFAPELHGPADVHGPTLAATGAAMYIKRDVIDTIGLFDEGYAMAFEDVDYCLRTWEAGFSVAYCARASLTHLESVTRGMEVGQREQASLDRFWSRWGSWLDEREVRTPDGRLRIIYVTEDTGVGGGHRDIFEHVNRLKARGHDVQLWSLAGQPEWFPLDVEVREFEDYLDLIGALSDEEAIKVATWWVTSTPVWLASVRRGIPVFFVQDIETSYYPDHESLRNAVLASYRPEFRYMTISGWNRERLREIGLDPALVPPGIDLETFRPLPGVHRRDDMVLALGRSNHLKNLPLTLDAWTALEETRPELCLFGVEPELGRGQGVRYVSRPTDDKVNELFNQTTVFVQTSIHEGFCLPPLEAMATGAAVVCTDAHGNRDFCVDGVNCFVPDATVESVSAAIRRLLDDPQLRRQFGEAGIRTAADYTWERRIDEVEEFFEAVAAKPQKPPYPNFSSPRLAGRSADARHG